jgi:hypothetical protein
MQVFPLGKKTRDIGRMTKDLFRLFPRIRLIRNFQEFTSTHLNLTDFANHRLAEICEEFDVLVAGSDQIWNPEIVSENSSFDEVFLLKPFRNHNLRRASFASSIGDYEPRDQDNLIQSLSNFSHISVREKSTSSDLTQKLRRKIDVCLDPTLLFDKRQWISMIKLEGAQTSYPKKYILLYSTKKDNLLRKSVMELSAVLGLDVIAVDQSPFMTLREYPFLQIPVKRHYRDAAPSTFLKLILNSSFVITNSFHGTGFAITFEKQFLTTPPAANTKRITGLLKDLELNDRFVSNHHSIREKLDEPIDFSITRKHLKISRERSMNYISRMILNTN